MIAGIKRFSHCFWSIDVLFMTENLLNTLPEIGRWRIPHIIFLDDVGKDDLGRSPFCNSDTLPL